METTTHTIRAGTVSLLPNGIIQFEVTLMGELDLAEITELLLATNRMMDRPRPLLVKHATPYSIASRARAELARRAEISALAILARTPPAVEAGRELLGSIRTSYPTKLFEEEAPALDWLGRYL